jgi:hypothetical protein
MAEQQNKQIVNLAELRAGLAARHTEMQNALPPTSGTKVRLKAKEGFVLPDGTTHTKLEAVVVDLRYVNAFYPKRYTPGVIESPTCWAVSKTATDIAPSDKSEKQVCDFCIAQGDITCPNNKFGSNGNGKACKNIVRIAIVPPDASANTQVLIIDLPPTSTSGFLKLIRGLKAPMQTVVIGLELDSAVDYAKVQVSIIGTVTENVEPFIYPLIDRAQGLLDRGFDYSPS